MEFCPSCANMLLYELSPQGARFACPTCPYVAAIENAVTIEKHLVLAKKTIDPILSTEDLRGPQETTIDCLAGCGHNKAGFFELQTRSADEPMTTFYQCRKCQYTWRDG